jgi:hypothetical protein
MAATAPEGKPPRRKRSSKRFAYHECYHHDAWNGMIGMSAEEVGLYWRIILLIYIRRAALSDADDVEIAAACHVPTKTFRRIKRKLIERGRLEWDEENHVYYDKRALEELIALGFFSQAQTERALKRWADRTPARPRVVVDNVGPLSDQNRVFFEESSEVLGVFSIVSQSQTEQNQEDGGCRKHANQYPIPNITLPTPSSVPARAALPPIGGGARRALGEMSAAERQQFLADQAARMGLTASGKEGEAERLPKQRQHSKAADRIARRA